MATTETTTAASTSNFSDYQSLEQFLNGKGLSSSDVVIVQTTKGFIMLAEKATNPNRPNIIASISRNLKGSDVSETAKKLASVNLTFGIPSGDGIPCVMEQLESTWQVASLVP